MTRTWLVSGSSTGLGRAIVEAALRAGHRVVATARRPETLADLTQQHADRLLPFALDVTARGDWDEAVAAARARFGSLDVLVNNAGFGGLGSVENTSQDEIDALFNTNFRGAVHACQAVLPVMRQQGQGRIILVSSIGARIATAGAAYYYASKAAVSSLAESLALEVSPFNIKVTAVEAGAMRTRFAEPTSLKLAAFDPAYEATVGATMAMMQSADFAAITQDPAGYADMIVKLADLDEVPTRLLAGADAYAMGAAAGAALHASDAHWESLSRSATGSAA